MSTHTSQLPFDLSVDMFLPSSDDWTLITEGYVQSISEVAAKHFPFFHYLKNVQLNILCNELPNMKKINKVIPLPVLHLNEQKYEDVVRILDFYEDIVTECFQRGGQELTSVHIGGDQLTRERFSGAKRLRIGGVNQRQQFKHLSPITFELFHMLMNFVSLVMHQLYNEESIQELGTLKCEQNRIMRDNVSTNVNENYDGNRDFIISFTDAHIAEAIMDFFGMSDTNSVPTKNQPPNFETDQQRKMWAAEKFKEISNRYIFQTDVGPNNNQIQEDGIVIELQLSNGQKKPIIIQKKSVSPDKVKSYAHLVLETGMIFKSLLKCKSPDRKTVNMKIVDIEKLPNDKVILRVCCKQLVKSLSKKKCSR